MYSVPRMGVYAIRGPKDCIYIGSARCIQQRWRIHKHDLKKGRHHSKYLQRAWDKYGEAAFSFEVLEEVAQAGDLISIEQKWLDNTFAARPKHAIYNNVRTAGSNIGHKHSEHSRRNMSKAHKGIPHGSPAPETIAKIAAANRGKRRTLAQTNRLAFRMSGGKAYTIVSPNGTIYQNIINVSVFASEHNLRGNLLRMVLRGEREHTEGWIGWIEGQEPETKPNFPKYTFIDPDGTIYANVIYPSRFAWQHNLTKSAVWRVLRGENKQHKGWTGFVQKE